MSYIHHTEFKKVSGSTILCGHCQKETNHIFIDAYIETYGTSHIEHTINNVPADRSKQPSEAEILDSCFRQLAKEENMDYTPYVALSLFSQAVYSRFEDRCPNCCSSGTYVN